MVYIFSHIFNRFTPLLVLCPIILWLISILALISITRTGETFPSREVLIQTVAFILGAAIALAVVAAGYSHLISFRKLLYPLSILFLLSVYIPGIGTSFYGSRSWLDLGAVILQPSEPVKLLYVLLIADYLASHRSDIGSTLGMIKALLYGLPFMVIVAREDMGSGLVYLAIWMFMIFSWGLDMRFFKRCIMSVLLSLPIIYYFLAGYQKERINAFLNPSDLSLPGNYQVWNSKIAIGSGQIFGKGYMRGTQNSLGFLPVAESDFMFASIVEETGFVGGVAVIGLYGLFFFQTLRIARFAMDLEGTLIAVGIMGMFFFQFLENIGMNMGILPVTGITLPFVSYGGSSIVTSVVAVGLLISVARRQMV